MTWYDDAADLAKNHEALDPARVHTWLDGLLPTEPGAAFGVGAGTGYDAACLASLGH